MLASLAADGFYVTPRKLPHESNAKNKLRHASSTNTQNYIRHCEEYRRFISDVGVMMKLSLSV